MQSNRGSCRLGQQPCGQSVAYQITPCDLETRSQPSVTESSDSRTSTRQVQMRKDKCSSIAHSVVTMSSTRSDHWPIIANQTAPLDQSNFFSGPPQPLAAVSHPCSPVPLAVAPSSPGGAELPPAPVASRSPPINCNRRTVVHSLAPRQRAHTWSNRMSFRIADPMSVN